jgi:ribosomal protein L3 glutamine methyltransferase
MLDTAREELLTLRDWLRYAVSLFGEAGLFFGHGSNEAYDEAAYLILHTLRLPLDRLEPFLDARLLLHEAEQVRGIIERRVRERIPAAYLTHEAWLGNFRFFVDERVIVPRSYIAEILWEHLTPWIEGPDRIRDVLDLCTGSGCLAVLMCRAFPNAHIDAVDLSGDALDVAKHNVVDYGLQSRIELIQSDLFDRLAGRHYDLIVSNPPYVNDASMESLPPEYRHEPAMALAGGGDGLDAVRIILEQATGHLNPGGLVVVEIGHNRDAVEAAYPALPFTWLETSGGDEFVFLLRREQLTGLPA